MSLPEAKRPRVSLNSESGRRERTDWVKSLADLVEILRASVD